MFKQVIRKFSTGFKPIYTSKEYVNLYINNSKDKFIIIFLLICKILIYQYK